MAKQNNDRLINAWETTPNLEPTGKEEQYRGRSIREVAKHVAYEKKGELRTLHVVMPDGNKWFFQYI